MQVCVRATGSELVGYRIFECIVGGVKSSKDKIFKFYTCDSWDRGDPPQRPASEEVDNCECPFSFSFSDPSPLSPFPAWFRLSLVVIFCRCRGNPLRKRLKNESQPNRFIASHTHGIQWDNNDEYNQGAITAPIIQLRTCTGHELGEKGEEERERGREKLSKMRKKKAQRRGKSIIMKHSSAHEVVRYGRRTLQND